MILATTPSFEPLRCVSTLPDVHQNVARAGSTAREFVQAAREELRQRHDGGAGGLAVVAAYTDAIDHLVEWLFDNATRPLPGEESAPEPALHRGRAGRLRPRRAEPAVRHRPALPLSVEGEPVRRDGRRDRSSPRSGTPASRSATRCATCASARASAARDLKVKTALLDARYLCGDRSLVRRVRRDIVVEEVWTPNRQAFFKEKLDGERGAPRQARRLASTCSSRS